MRKNSENIKPGDNMSLRVEVKDKKQTRHMLEHIPEGPFPVTKIDEKAKTFVIERTEKYVESVSRSCVLIAPAPITQSVPTTITHPMPISE